MLVNLSWRICFSKIYVQHLAMIKFDYSPLWVNFNKPVTKNHYRHLFRFLVAWFLHKDLKNVMTQNWRGEEIGMLT